MKGIIDKIEYSESATKYCIEWLAENKNNGLDDAYTTTLIRFLLKKVVELETKIDK